MRIFYNGRFINPKSGKGNSIKCLTSKKRLIAKYKFDKSIYENLIPEFNTGFTDYEIVDEYLDTVNMINTTTETIMLMNYNAEPDEYGVLTTEYEIETVNEFLAENIVTRSIYSNELPTMIRFGIPWISSDYDRLNATRSHSLLNILEINTSMLNTCEYMFRACINLTSIDCDFIISNVNSLFDIFEGCGSLTSLDVSNWDLSNTTNMGQLFRFCLNLERIDGIETLNTHNVMFMQNMFQQCSKLIELDISNWNVSNVTNMNGMFRDCNNIETINVSNWDTDKVASMNSMFTNCGSLINVTMNDSDYNSVNKIINVLPNNNGVLNIVGVNDLSRVNVSTAQSKGWTIIDKYLVARYKFDKSIYENLIPEFNTEFNDYEIVDEYLDTEDVLLTQIDTINMFGEEIYDEYGINTLEEIENEIITYSTARAENIVTRSIYAKELPTLMRFGANNTGEWTNTDARANSLLSVSDLNANLTTMRCMFTCCTNLREITCDIDTSKVTDMVQMFANCTVLASLSINNFNTNNVTNITNMFQNSTSLSNITMKDSDYASVNKIIGLLLTRTSTNPGTLTITGVDNLTLVNTTNAQSKYWNIVS